VAGAGAEPRTERLQAWRRDRRAAIRRFHPDRGGTAEELARALAEVDACYELTMEPTPAGDEGVVVVTRGRGYLLRRGLHRVRLLVRELQGRLPERWPGARREVRL
jgi:hypothetical protein